MTPLTGGQRVRWALTDYRVLTGRFLIRYLRSPEGVVFTLIQPVIFVLLFRYVFGGAIRVPTGSYVDYLIPGVIAQTAAFSSVGTAMGLAEDLKRGIIDRLKSMPIARSAVLVGRLAADGLQSLAVMILLVAVGYLVGFRVHTGPLQLVAMVAVAVAFSLAICTISAAIGLTLKEPESVQSFGLLWLFPLTFASAAFVPVQTMPGWLQAFARVNPVTIIVDAMRGLVLGGPVGHRLWQSLAWVLAILVVFVPISVRAYRRVA